MNKMHYYRIFTDGGDELVNTYFKFSIFMVVLEDLESEVLRLVNAGHTIVKVELMSYG
jgi:hypothetical protein